MWLPPPHPRPTSDKVSEQPIGVLLGTSKTFRRPAFYHQPATNLSISLSVSSKRPTSKTIVDWMVLPQKDMFIQNLWKQPIWKKGLCRSKQVKNLRMRSYWIGVGPKSNDKCSYKLREGERQKEGRWHEDRGRDWNYVSINQGIRRTVNSHQKHGMKSTLESTGKKQPCQHLDFRLPASRTVSESISVVFKPSVYIVLYYSTLGN